MDTESSVTPGRYALSFTTGALLAREAALLAPLFVQHRDWETVRRLALDSNVLQVRTHSTGIRLVRETVKRLSVLADDEVALVAEVTASERSHLMWAAACRRYELIGEFAEEILRERFLLLAPTLGHQDFDSFVRSKALWHDEVAEIKDSTLRKLRSNVFRMLKEARLLSGGGRIMPAVLSERISVALVFPRSERPAILPDPADGWRGDGAVIPKTLPEQEEHLVAVLRGDRFLQMEGLGNEVPFFIYPYPPEAALEVAGAKKRVKNRLRAAGVKVFEINLYDLSVELLKGRKVWDRVLAVEPDQDKADFRELLQGMLDPQLHIAPAIRDRLAQEEFDIFFLTGIGEVFPYIRSHNVLNNLQSVVKGKPMLMFFPGRYEQSDTLGSSLVLFGRLKDDQYYRAKNILEQEA